LERSVTARTPDVVVHLLSSLRDQKRQRLLDVGCGYGGLAKTIADHLTISEVYGVDIDPEVVAEAHSKGVKVHCLDVDHEALPFPNNHFDLVTCFGMLDYLPFFDNSMREMFRVLRPGDTSWFLCRI
jgi:ubiquinone/menaquinone biosynthesis C-methylase UbiE